MQLYPYKQVSINQPPSNPFVNIFKALERAKKRDVAIRIWEVVQQEWPPSNLFKKNALYKFLDYRNVDYSSILSKKLAAGLQYLVMDLKCGNGAFMNNFDDAKALAQSIVDVANGAGTKTRAVLTDMNQVLGTSVGNALEVEEAVQY